MVRCPYCACDSPEAFNFCVQCERQIHCAGSDCRATLVPGKTRCLMCGRPVVGDEPVTTNRLVRDVSASGGVYTERIEIHATDSALGQFAPLLLGVATRARQQGHSLSVTGPSLQASLPFDDADSPAALPELPHLADAQSADEIVLPGHNAADFFDTVDDTLAPRLKTFKGSTKKECQARLVVMFAWAYREIYGRPAPTRDLFNKVAVVNGLYDPNWRKYFSRTAGQYLTITSQGFTLSPDGERKVREILRDMDDENVFGYLIADGGEETR